MIPLFSKNSQTVLTLACSHTQKMNVDEDSYLNLDLLPCSIHQHGHLLEAFGHMKSYQNVLAYTMTILNPCLFTYFKQFDWLVTQF